IVRFLLARVGRERVDRASRTDFSMRSSYDAIPFQGFSGLRESLRATEEYDSLIEELCDALMNGMNNEGTVRDDARVVLGQLGPWDDTFERVVKRWIESRDCRRLRASALLFEERPRNFAIVHSAFVAELLEAANACGLETYEPLVQSIENATFANDYYARGEGTPHPVTLRIDRKSTRLNSSHVKTSYAVS